MATHKHKYKVGDKVIVEDKQGTIFTIGYATAKSRKFTVCDPTKEIDESNPLGYQVQLGRFIKIVKESNITKI